MTSPANRRRAREAWAGVAEVRHTHARVRADTREGGAGSARPAVELPAQGRSTAAMTVPSGSNSMSATLPGAELFNCVQVPPIRFVTKTKGSSALRNFLRNVSILLIQDFDGCA